MYRIDRTNFVRAPYLWLWSVLGFQAGYLNAFGFLACGRYVSHVTGFGTQIGMALANKLPLFAFELLGIPLFFIFGSFVSGMSTIVRIEKGLKPRYDLVTIAITSIIFILLSLGPTGLFGVFGEQELKDFDFMLLFLLTFVCGMQNSCFAILTHGQIRTTHLTGISTDIGVDLSRMWLGRLNPIEQKITRGINTSRFVTLISFTMGSILSVLVSSRLQYGALIVPLVSSIGIATFVILAGNIDRRKEARNPSDQVRRKPRLQNSHPNRNTQVK